MADVEYTALARKVREDLESVKANLEMAYSGIVTASAALKYQAADRDIDVADVLERFVANQVYRQIRWAEDFMESLRLGTATDLDRVRVDEGDEREGVQ